MGRVPGFRGLSEPWGMLEEEVKVSPLEGRAVFLSWGQWKARGNGPLSSCLVHRKLSSCSLSPSPTRGAFYLEVPVCVYIQSTFSCIKGILRYFSKASLPLWGDLFPGCM